MVPGDAVWAVLTAFHPQPNLVDAVSKLIAQMDGVVVVDDGSGDEFDDVFRAAQDLGAVVRRHARNQGVAAALNSGIAHARSAGAGLVFTFDQDSLVATSFRDAMVGALRTAQRDGHHVGLVVPEFFAHVRQGKGASSRVLLARNVIQSGMLLDMRTLTAVGGFREDFFIDLVDTEFELRVRRAGMLTIAAPGVRLDHRLGAQYRRRVFGVPMGLPPILPATVTLSTPFRYFYRVRNRAILNRIYRGFEPQARLKDTLIDRLHFMDVITMARPRVAMWRVMTAGRSAARRGRMGRMPDTVTALARTITWNVTPTNTGTDGR